MDACSLITKVQLLNVMEVKKSINMVDNFPKYGLNEKDKRELLYPFINIETHV